MGLRTKYTKTCQNPICSRFSKYVRGNLIYFGKQKNGNQRYKCTTCNKTFSQTKNTFRFYSHFSRREIIDVCRMLGNKMSYRSIARKTNKHLDTIRSLNRRIRENMSDFRKDLSTKEFRALRKRVKSSNS